MCNLPLGVDFRSLSQNRPLSPLLVSLGSWKKNYNIPMSVSHRRPSSTVNSVQHETPQLLIPSPGRFRAGRARRAAAPRSYLEPLLGAELELPLQLRAGVFAVYEVTKPSTDTALARVQTAAGLAEIRHGAEFAINRPSSVPARVQIVARFLG